MYKRSFRASMHATRLVQMYSVQYIIVCTDIQYSVHCTLYCTLFTVSVVDCRVLKLSESRLIYNQSYRAYSAYFLVMQIIKNIKIYIFYDIYQ